jgi:hypothetical protein
MLLIGFLAGRGTAPTGADQAAPRRSIYVGGPQLPTGYSHDTKGAAGAAANLSAALARSIAEGPAKVRHVAGIVGTEGYAARVDAAYAGRQVVDPSAPILFQAVPISYRVLSYSPTEAAVRIWSASILAGDDASPGAASFKTATIVVRWAGNWKLDDVRDAVPGPTPRTTNPTPGLRFMTDLAQTETFLVQP